MRDPLGCSSISRREAARIIGVTAAAGVFGVMPIRGELPQPDTAPDWSQLRAKIVGELFAAEDAAFEGLRQSLVWNERKPERAPGAIVRVASVEDVQHAVDRTAVDGDDRPSAARDPDQTGDVAADAGDARHLGVAGAIEMHRHGIRELRRARAAGARVHDGQRHRIESRQWRHDER